METMVSTSEMGVTQGKVHDNIFIINVLEIPSYL